MDKSSSRANSTCPLRFAPIESERSVMKTLSHRRDIVSRIDAITKIWRRRYYRRRITTDASTIITSSALLYRRRYSVDDIRSSFDRNDRNRCETITSQWRKSSLRWHSSQRRDEAHRVAAITRFASQRISIR